ncbi:hypothetical protein [Leifsonia sp. 2MCAF36]|uniref:hypothetical protein n=1 Tax=Leifsonia sp. 2MCAF36 TaxID=3232988 RepID=UPI003F96367A
MPAIQPPHIAVDARAWHGAHPGGTVRICYAGSCDEKDDSALEFELIVPAAMAPGEEHPLAVTETDSDGTGTFTARVALERIPGQPGAPCPMPDQWSLRLTILLDGRLRFDGADDGHLVIPTVPQTPDTTPTPGPSPTRVGP